MAVRLRYLAHDLEVPEGQFVIGRAADCQLSLDDPLVSRRHALFTVAASSVVVEDLGSRNGVLVNDARIEGPAKVHDGDKITIGGQVLIVSITADVPSSRRATIDTMQYRQQEQTLAAMHPKELVEDDESTTTSIVTSDMLPAINPDRRVSPLSLIGGVADKALALGRADEAERLLSRALGDVASRVRSGQNVSHDTVDQAAAYAAKLAVASGRGVWVDQIIEMYSAQRRLLPASMIDELYRVVRKVKNIDLATLRAYTAILREGQGSYSPNERFLLQRIEGLERLGSVL